jgi:hypothetical protein
VVSAKNPNFPCYVAPDFLQYLSEEPKSEKAKTRKEISNMKNRNPLTKLTLLLAVLLTLGALAAAVPTAASPPVAVSSTSLDPFASCTSDFPDLQPGTFSPNSEVEPSVAVNPSDEQNIVAVWQQDRWSILGGSRGIVAAASFDGGATWATVVGTKTTLCAGGTAANGGGMFRATNGWVSFGPDGLAYLVSMGIPFFDETAVLVSTSSDGGRTWHDPSVLELETNNAMNDKPTITADPNHAGTAYAVWTRNEYPVGQAAPTAEDVTAASRGPGWFARTLDGGRTWEPAREIFDPGEQNGTIGHQIVVLPADRLGGELVDVFEFEYGHKNSNGLRGIHVGTIRSRDEGLTWSERTLIADALFIPVRDPLTGARIRAGATIPNVGVDPRDGTLYAVWLDARFSDGAHNDIALSMSTDGGLTWASPTKANQTPADLDPPNAQAFTPSVHVAADGSLAVSYYDFRNNGTDSDPSQPLETDRFIAVCSEPSASAPDRCASGWTETRLTPTSFNLRVAPNSEGLFLGGYEGLASAGNQFVSVFTQANSAADPATVYFSALP